MINKILCFSKISFKRLKYPFGGTTIPALPWIVSQIIAETFPEVA